MRSGHVPHHDQATVHRGACRTGDPPALRARHHLDDWHKQALVQGATQAVFDRWRALAAPAAASPAPAVRVRYQADDDRLADLVYAL